MGFPKRLLADDERLVLVLRRHVKAVFGPFLVLVAVATLAGVAAAYTPDGVTRPWVWLTIAVVAVVLLLRWSLWPILVWWNTVYAITTRRLVLREGVLNRSGHDMPLTRLNDVSFTHNVWERMLGCGTLMVESAGERGQILLEDVPKVELVQRTLYRLSDDLRGVDRDGPDAIDGQLARDLDDGFDEEYQGPAGQQRPNGGEPGR
jgi:uncharacterized membrane protein YdbT with pleckstrin-like domain